MYDPPTTLGPPSGSAGFGPPPGAPPFSVDDGVSGSGGGDDGGRKKLVIIYASVVGALLLALIALAVWAFMSWDGGEITVTSSSTSESSSTTKTTTTTSSEASETTTTTEQRSGEEVTEGDFAFAVNKVDNGSTITSPINDQIQKTASGEFIVVYLDVGNTGGVPQTFLGTLQRLNADGTSFVPDDEASFYLGGGVVTIDPGAKVEVAVAFDVPVGTTPNSIEIHGIPGGPGVELPL